MKFSQISRLTCWCVAHHDLSAYRSLVHLQFESIPILFTHGNRAQLQTFLSSIESPHLKSLVFTIALPSLTSVASLTWYSFDNTLSRLAGMCPKLTITFSMEAHKQMQDWNRESAQYHTDRLASQLSKTLSQGAYFVVLFRHHKEKSVQGQAAVDVYRFDPTPE